MRNKILLCDLWNFLNGIMTLLILSCCNNRYIASIDIYSACNGFLSNVSEGIFSQRDVMSCYIIVT